MSRQLFLSLLESNSLSLSDSAAIDELESMVVAALFGELMAPLLTGWAFGDCGNCAAISDDERNADQSVANYRRSVYQAFSCRNQLAQVQKVEDGKGWEVATPNINSELCQLGTIVMSRAIEDFYLSDPHVAQPVRKVMNVRVNYVQVALRKLVIETDERNTMLYMYRISDWANLDDRYAELASERYGLLAEIAILDEQLLDMNAKIEMHLNVLAKWSSDVESVLLSMRQGLNLTLISAQSEEDELLITRFRAVLVESFQKWLESLERQMNVASVGERRLCTFMQSD